MIQIKNVNFTYANAEAGALRDVSLEIQQGECVLLCGESGCGKTTITRLINGLIPHFYEGNLEGQINVAGLEIQNEELYTIATRVGSVFQSPRSQFFCLDTTSEMAFGCENMGLPEKEILHRIDGVAEELHIKRLMGRNIFKLSGGEKQQVACGSVSAMRPEVIVLDEPTSNLDLDAIQELKRTLALWKKQGKTIVIAEHRLYWLREVCDRVVYMQNGKIGFDIPMKKFCAFSKEKLEAFGLRSLSLEKVHFPEKVVQKEEMIRLKNYTFSYEKKTKPVLELMDAQVPEGSVIAVTGHNGAGKSTFLRCMCGLEKKFQGRTVVHEQEKKYKQMLRECYMVMQDVNHQLFCETVEDEIVLGMDEANEALIPQLLQELDLTEITQRHPMALSGGQKQRVAIASAILADKSILIFDEPTSGLDYRHMKQTAALFRELQERGKTVFIITHDPELIAMCASHVFHMEEGKLQEFYPLNEEHTSLFIEQFAF